MARIPLCCLALWMLAAGATEARGEDLPIKEVLALGHGVPQKLVFGAHESRRLLLQSVYGATQLTGRITKTGTLAPGPGGQYVYQPEPADRLVVLVGAVRNEFTVSEVNGNVQAATAEDWLAADHVLRYRHRLGDLLDVEIADSSAGGAVTLTVKGRVAHAGRKIQADLAAKGTYRFASDLAGYSYRTDYRTTGCLKGEGLEVAVSEDHEFELVVARGRSGSRTATVSRDAIRNRLTQGEDAYVWDARFVKDFLDGRPSQKLPSVWTITGTIKKNGEDWAKYFQGGFTRRVGTKFVGTTNISLQLPGEKIVLETFNF